MFENIASGQGRIGRLEYGLSLFAFLIIHFLIILLEQYLLRNPMVTSLSWIYTILIPLLKILNLFFLFLQGSKRCHDLGKSAFYQFIPFYILFLVLQKSHNSSNRYGHPSS